MDLIQISKTEVVNVDLIEAILTRKVKDQTIITLVIGGKSYTPDMDSIELLKSLISKGTVKATNQFFAV